MVTSKPIATISYNSPNFLMGTLKELISHDLIDDYRIINHLPEEENKKEHFHLWLSPCRKLDTSSLQKRFVEPVPDNDKPLVCLPFRSSEPLNWILYVLHDKDYIALHSKDASGDGKIEYSPMDIVRYCREYFDTDYLRAQSIRTSTSVRALHLAQDGYSFSEILQFIPNINPSALSAIIRGVHQH